MSFTAVAIIVVLLAWLPRLGSWLVIEEPLATADAIVVLGGNLPFRSQEAAALYREGWAREVWITAPEGAAEVEAVKNLGLPSGRESELSRQVLEHYGVPTAAIIVLSNQAGNTTHEIQLIQQELSNRHFNRVILVTSRVHTRRVRETWDQIKGSTRQLVVRHAGRDVFDADRWWRTARDRATVAHEALGIMYILFVHA